MITTVSTFEQYVNLFPESTQKHLTLMRTIVRKAAPKATEKIAYAIPTYMLTKNICHFGGFKNHIGFYPGPACLQEFAKELTDYKTTKGAVQFPLSENIPVALVSAMVKFCVRRDAERIKK